MGPDHDSAGGAARGGSAAQRSSSAAPPRRIDWVEFGELCKSLAVAADTWARTQRVALEAVVGIALGGSIVGAAVASLLRLDFYPIRLARRAESPGHNTRRVVVPPTRDVAGRHVLLCDDIARTGDTFRIALHELRQAGARAVTTAAMVRVERGFRPDVEVLEVPAEALFPWETDYVAQGELIRRV
jgi:hypoxanthine phosphoribosyltransferase